PLSDHGFRVGQRLGGDWWRALRALHPLHLARELHLLGQCQLHRDAGRWWSRVARGCFAGRGVPDPPSGIATIRRRLSAVVLRVYRPGSGAVPAWRLGLTPGRSPQTARPSMTALLKVTDLSRQFGGLT